MSSQVGAVVGLLCVAATLVPSLALAVFGSITGLLVFVTALLLMHMAYALFAALPLYFRRAFSLGPTVRIPISAPVASSPNFLGHFQDREKTQLPQAFARQAWGLESGTFRQFALRTPICLRSLRVGHFTLQAFS
jgi:hypothetical protein